MSGGRRILESFNVPAPVALVLLAGSENPDTGDVPGRVSILTHWLRGGEVELAELEEALSKARLAMAKGEWEDPDRFKITEAVVVLSQVLNRAA